MSGEVLPFPVQNNTLESKGDIGKHFEDAPEETVEQVVFRYKNWLELLNMGPGDRVAYLEAVRKFTFETANDNEAVQNIAA